MAKEHKKLYKAGKNWVVATLTATTITLLGGIGAYTAHADTTAENNQSTETSNISQSSQSDNSSNSVVLTQPVTTQSNQTALSNQSEQSTPTNQATSTAATNITTTNSFNKVTPNNYGAVNESNNLLLTQKKTNDSSLRYTPSVSGFEGDVEESGLGEVDRKISDPVYPNITVYYSFFHSTDKPEIQQYAHKEVTRDIYIKDPQTGVESLDRHDLVIFNRWVAVDTTRNNQLVGLGPWVLSLTSPKSFPKYNIPQKNGYTSYCNGKKTTMIDEEQVSGNQPGEIYHITYVSDSSIIAKKTRTIIINYPNGEQKSTFVQNAELDGSTYSWPEYIIPGEVGYDSYVDGHKATSIPTQTVHVYDNDNVIVNVTYRRPVSDPTHKTITRTIYIHDIDGSVWSIPQAVVYTRYAISDTQGNIVSYTNWVADGNSSLNEYAIPQHEGFVSQIGSEDTKVVPSQLVNPNDEDTIVNVTYKKTPVTPSKDKHKAITRTIKIAYPSGYVQTISQTVNYTYHTVKIGSEVFAGWVADGNDSWDEYAIPQHDGFISQVDSQDAKIVPSQHVTSNDENVIVNVTYKQAPATSTSKQHKTITRTISLHDINGNILNTIQQKVNYTRNVITDTEGNTVSHTDWIADGNDSWNEYTIPQHEGYKSQVDSQDATVVPSQHVNPNDKDVDVSITYIKTDSSKGNGNVDDNNNPSRLNTGTINYIDPDGKVVKTDHVSGKVGDKVDVKISLPDGYELANKDEHIPSVIAVTENGIGTINVNVKKINTTLANNEVPYDSTTVSKNVNANYGYLDSYRLTENNQGQAQLIASGWHATGASNSDRYRYMIVFDNTLGHEIARQKLVPQVRSDVQRAYPNVDNSLYSGFNITIDIPNSSINHSLSLIARYSNDPNNGEGARVDYWFNPLALNEGNQAYLDGLSSNGNTLTVTGWHATNQAAGRPYHYIIAWDQNLGHEIARQKVTAVSRPDVANAYSTVANAVNSGFSVRFNLTPQFFNDNIQFISRWTDDAAGNGNAVDYWFKPMNRTNRANLDSVTLSNGQVKVAGWHATDLSQLEPNHYLIVFDNTTGQQVASEKVGLQSSQDVKNVFGDVQTANHSRFNYAFNSLHLISGHNYSLVSRYSADANGNGNDGAHTDSWLNMGTFQQSAYSIDHVALNRRHMTVQGWVANDNAMTRPYAYAILLQNGHEIGRQRLNLSERADVAKVYPQIYRSQYSGFNTSFDLPTASTNGLQLVLRFTDDPAGNGNSSDKWINL
ncbi:mucin-binding protein [Limosilactobacillus reuteri]|uniref:mucin-binding protein n=1 Tax=Limosilactobacillus reuteri TaxID=1598 RepID=UPI000A2E7A75|nr:KxYKxGKxW signal peptide domain-containing protein [Limosilactobacillus reuteri]OTA83897.1 hypothetical protein BHL84_09715 [Limosilactobacillus reuteri]